MNPGNRIDVFAAVRGRVLTEQLLNSFLVARSTLLVLLRRTLIGLALGWTVAGAVVLGLAISVASTVVLSRALAERRELDSPSGRVAVGWLIVEDLFTVLVLLLLPVLAPALGAPPAADSGHAADIHPALAVALLLAKVVAFGALMLGGGGRAIRWLLSGSAWLNLRPACSTTNEP